MYRLVALCLLFVASLGCGSANKPTANTNGSAVDELLAQGNDLRTTDPDAAIEKYRQAGELNGGSPQALNNLALLSAETGRHDDAIAALQRLDVIAPAQSEKTRSLIREWSLSFLGGAHIQLDMGELQSAQENYELYIKYNPESDEGFTGRGNVLMAQGNLDEAEEAFKTALRLNPNLVWHSSVVETCGSNRKTGKLP